MLRRLITLAILLAVAAGLAWAFWPRPLAVETAKVERRDISVTVEEEGKTRIREVFTVSAPISGQTMRIGLHPGDPVVKDETVSSRSALPRPAARRAAEARGGSRLASAARAWAWPTRR